MDSDSSDGSPRPLRLEERLVSAVKGFLAVLTMVGVGLMFANVVARHVFAASFYWAEEAVVYLNIWSVFIGVIVVTCSNSHLRMDLLLRAMSQPWRRLVCTASLLTTIAVSAVVLVGSWSLLKQLGTAGLRSVALELPMIYVHLAVFTGFSGVMLVRTICTTRFLILAPREELVSGETE